MPACKPPWGEIKEVAVLEASAMVRKLPAAGVTVMPGGESLDPGDVACTVAGPCAMRRTEEVMPPADCPIKPRCTTQACGSVGDTGKGNVVEDTGCPIFCCSTGLCKLSWPCGENCFGESACGMGRLASGTCN